MWDGTVCVLNTLIRNIYELVYVLLHLILRGGNKWSNKIDVSLTLCLSYLLCLFKVLASFKVNYKIIAKGSLCPREWG